MKIGYLGIDGSFSHEAAIQRFGNVNQLIGVDSFNNLFLYLKNRQLDQIIVPFENSLAGPVIQNYDYVYNHNVKIIGEEVLPISHCLAVTPGVGLSTIQAVYSHTKALEQCQNFFKANPFIKPIPASSTANAARTISQARSSTEAAICSLSAAKNYGLEVLLERIEDNHNNWTRFFVLSDKDIRVENPTKASIAYTLNKSQSGSLYRSLAPFVDNDINLVSVESRPIGGSFFEYVFYLDLVFEDYTKFKTSLSALDKITASLKILGVYKGFVG